MPAGVRNAPEQITLDGIGRLQWWSLAEQVDYHWYVGEDQSLYQVRIFNWKPVMAWSQAGLPVWTGRSLQVDQDRLC
jgi:hypothetical protein